MPQAKFMTEAMAPKLGFSEIDTIRGVCKESFWCFVQEFWNTVVAETPVWNWHIPFLCNELQVMAERVFRGGPSEYDIIVNIPPGTTKSTVASVLFQAWTIARMPSFRHICGSHTEALVLSLSRLGRDVIRSEKYQKCFPEVVIRDDQDTKGYWVTSQGGGRFGATVGGKSPTGFHAHAVIIDDPIDPQKSVSEAECNRANRWIDRVLPTRKVDKLVSITALIMQRLAQNDPTGFTLDKAATKLRWICLPAEYSKEIRPRYLRKKYKENKNLLDPHRLSQAALAEHKLRGAFYYSSQFMQTPIPEGGGMFKTHRVHVDLLPPSLSKFKYLVRFWDKSATLLGGAYTVGLLLGEDYEGRFWVLDVIRVQLDTFQREQLIVQTAKLDGLQTIVGLEQEPGSGGKDSLLATIKRLAGFRVSSNKPSGSEASKLLRADPVSTQVNGGNVYLKPADWNHVFLEEMRFFPYSRYKDQIDSLSGAFAEVTKPRLKIGAL